VYVDLHLIIAFDASIERGHAIAHAVEAELRSRFAEVADVVVHVEPAEAPVRPDV
jgi:divalent metal cation (Fe/Co/Zn/Cd) transporter